MIYKLLDKIINKDESIINDGTYEFNGIKVPRVTNVLSFIHEEYLMKWANNIGLYQRKRYEDVRNKSAVIGTHTHNGIEEYIKNNSYSNAEENVFDLKDAKQINNGIESFILWYNDLKSTNNIEIIFIEEKMSCPYCGGTLDMLCKINGVYYLVDFKTSNHIGYKYFMQLAAYRYMLKYTKNIDIGGCIILQVDKKKISYTEYMLDFKIPFHLDFINQCERTFFATVYAMYNKMITEQMFKKYQDLRELN